MIDQTPYVSAGEMPWKLIKQAEKAIDCGRIRPLYLQLKPTNRCNANCSWCSTKIAGRDAEMPFAEVHEVLRRFHQIGTKAVSISGGGEPTVHPHFEDIVYTTLGELDMQVAVTSNGLRPKSLISVKECLSWVRISVIDTFGNYPTERIGELCRALDPVDCGISFVVSPGCNFVTAKRLAMMVNEIPNLTHIRFVSDLNDPRAASQTMSDLKKTMADAELLQNGIYQYRLKAMPGPQDCWVSLLKPQVYPDGYIYPCCGIQYMADSIDEFEKFRMCHWRDFWWDVKPFDGRACTKCYYGNYCEVLGHLRQDIKHGAFV